MKGTVKANIIILCGMLLIISVLCMVLTHNAELKHQVNELTAERDRLAHNYDLSVKADSLMLVKIGELSYRCDSLENASAGK